MGLKVKVSFLTSGRVAYDLGHLRSARALQSVGTHCRTTTCRKDSLIQKQFFLFFRSNNCNWKPLTIILMLFNRVAALRLECAPRKIWLKIIKCKIFWCFFNSVAAFRAGVCDRVKKNSVNLVKILKCEIFWCFFNSVAAFWLECAA